MRGEVVRVDSVRGFRPRRSLPVEVKGHLGYRVQDGLRRSIREGEYNSMMASLQVAGPSSPLPIPSLVPHLPILQHFTCTAWKLVPGCTVKAAIRPSPPPPPPPLPPPAPPLIPHPLHTPLPPLFLQPPTHLHCMEALARLHCEGCHRVEGRQQIDGGKYVGGVGMACKQRRGNKGRRARQECAEEIKPHTCTYSSSTY